MNSWAFFMVIINLQWLLMPIKVKYLIQYPSISDIKQYRFLWSGFFFNMLSN